MCQRIINSFNYANSITFLFNKFPRSICRSIKSDCKTLAQKIAHKNWSSAQTFPVQQKKKAFHFWKGKKNLLKLKTQKRENH